MGNPNCGACGHMNTRGFCNLTACIFPCPTGMGGYINKPQTNADRIRSMTDEELDGFLNEVQGDAYLVGFHARSESRFTPYGKSWLDWMKQEAK